MDNEIVENFIFSIKNLIKNLTFLHNLYILMIMNYLYNLLCIIYLYITYYISYF